MRPVAERILAAQQAADLQHYNDRFDSQRQVASEMERLQPRGDLPAVPALVPGGDPDLWREMPAVVVGAVSPDPVAAIEAGFTARLPDLPPTTDQLLRRLREWQPERSKFDAAIRRLTRP